MDKPAHPFVWRNESCILHSNNLMGGSTTMPGIAFLIDPAGSTKPLLIDLRKHQEPWAALYAAYVANLRHP